jgi:hypothetical protein
VIGDLAALTDLVVKAGVVPLLLLDLLIVSIGAFRGWWVPGPRFQTLELRCTKLERRCDRWQELAMRSLSDADKAVALSEFFRDVAVER